MELTSTLPSRYGLQPDELKEAIAYQNLYNDARRSDSAYEKLQATYEQLRARGVRWVWAPGTREQLRLDHVADERRAALRRRVRVSAMSSTVNMTRR